MYRTCYTKKQFHIIKNPKKNAYNDPTQRKTPVANTHNNIRNISWQIFRYDNTTHSESVGGDA